MEEQIPPGGFLAITRHQEVGEVPGYVEMIPTSLPELPKTLQDPGKLPKTNVLEPEYFQTK